MAWRVERTESFAKWWKKEKVDEGNYKFHEQALQDFQPTPLAHNVQTCVFKNTSFECWITRLPDKMRHQGKSGGFRVVLILDLEEKVILLQGIFRRSHLSWGQGSHGKHDDAYSSLIKDLAQQFIEVEH